MLDDLRDELARACGFEYRDGCWFRKDGEPWPLTQHPFPPGDLTALAAAWPDNWGWARDNGDWQAWCHDRIVDSPVVEDTCDEYADRLRLTLAVLKAQP